MYQGSLSPVGRLERTSQPPQVLSSTRPLLTTRRHTVIVRVGRPFIMEKLITSGVNMKKLPATTINLFRIRVSALKKGFMSVAHVGKPSAATTDLFTRKFTLGKSHMSVVNVGYSLAKFLDLLNTREFTVVQSLMDAENVESYLPITSVL